MKKFCIIGVAGFVAKKHLNCIKNLKGKLIAACDKHDNVGFLDSYFPEAKFFNDEKLFFSFIKKTKPNYLIICSPSYLHYRHIHKGFQAGLDVIVEKPPLLSHQQYKNIINLEKKYKKRCFCIFQLRVNKKLKSLKSEIEMSNKINEVEISYTTYRGDWYFKTWKNNIKKSGGLSVNIGIHFFDILIWIFGDILEFKINYSSQSKIIGSLKLKKAKVKWLLSIERVRKKNDYSYMFQRYMVVNSKKFNFEKFNDLHEDNYDMILNKKKFHLSEFEKTIRFIKYLKK